MKGPTGMLPRDEILRRLFDPKLDSRLFLVPLFGDEGVGNGTIDLRLGPEFVLSKRTRYAGLDPLEGVSKGPAWTQEFRSRLADYQEKISLRLGKGITLHPQQFALGSSLEYARLPYDIGGYVLGRSSWGRLGLVIATATMVHPGFFGSITLE